MSKFVIYHTLVATAMTLLIGIATTPVAGAAFATSFYYSRELSQHQTELAKTRGVKRSSLWYIVWPKGHTDQWLVPAAVSTAVGGLLQYLGG